MGEPEGHGQSGNRAIGNGQEQWFSACSTWLVVLAWGSLVPILPAEMEVNGPHIMKSSSFFLTHLDPIVWVWKPLVWTRYGGQRMRRETWRGIGVILKKPHTHRGLEWARRLSMGCSINTRNMASEQGGLGFKFWLYTITYDLGQGHNISTQPGRIVV